MPFALIIIGIVLITAGVRGKQSQLYDLIKNDVTGEQGYLKWIVTILIIGAIGYVPSLKPISRAFMILVIIVLLLSNKGFFTQFNQQVFANKK